VCSLGAARAAACKPRPAEAFVRSQLICAPRQQGAAACVESARMPSPMQCREVGATPAARACASAQIELADALRRRAARAG